MEAVSALHKTMVLLREELVRKDLKIKQLEARFNRDLEVIQVEGEESIKEENDDEEVHEAFNNGDDMVTEDPIMAFIAEGDDEEEEENNSMLLSDVKVHTLMVHQDIDLHQFSPQATFSQIRPILRLPSNSPRSCTGSQTDISALSPYLYNGQYGILNRINF